MKTHRPHPMPDPVSSGLFELVTTLAPVPPPYLLKLVHYVAYPSIAKQAVGLRLEALLSMRFSLFRIVIFSLFTVCFAGCIGVVHFMCGLV